MWTRYELKTQAKSVLGISYWSAFLVCLIMIGIESAATTVASFIPMAPLAVSLLLMPALVVGQMRWFSRNREAAAVPDVGQVFHLFRGENWGKSIGAMLWMYLFLFLWSLPAVIPTLFFFWTFIMSIMFRTFRDYELPAVFNDAYLGILLLVAFVVVTLLLSVPVIVKGYSYRMTPWILGDNPQIGYQRALKLSMDLTRGHKFNMFVLDLSFLGWFLLGILACGIGILFVIPYYQAVYAELYARLRRLAVENGLSTMEEFGFVRTGFPQT